MTQQNGIGGEFLRDIQAEYTERVEFLTRYAGRSFRHIGRVDVREDLVQEAVAYGWKHYRIARERGQDPREDFRRFARQVVKHVRCYRRLAGQERPRDVLSPRGQVLGHLAVRSISEPRDNPRMSYPGLTASLRSRRAGPADEAVLRVDLERFRNWINPRLNSLLGRFLAGERTSDIAGPAGVTAGAISQARRTLLRKWREFHGE